VRYGWSAIISKYHAQTTVGRWLRLPLRCVPKSATVRILSGPNRGYRWIVGSGVHGYWIGCYERQKCEKMLPLLASNLVAYDIGAHVGYYTLLFARYCKWAYAFEPNPRNVFFLKRHIAMNGIPNVTVLPVAISDRATYLRFDDSLDSSMGRLDVNGNVIVRTETIDGLVEGRLIEPPGVMKIDVEGEELNVVKGALRTIRMYRPALAIAIDAEQNRGPLVDVLKRNGYSIEFIAENEVLAVAR